MSSTEPSAESNPPAVSFAQKREGADTRWGPGVVAAIIAAIALVAAGITAAVVLSKNPPATEPPNAPVLPMDVTSAAAASPLSDFQRVKLMSSQTTLAGGETLMAAGDTVKLGDSGVSFDVPSGWKALPGDDGSVMVGNKSTGVAMVAIFGNVTDKSGSSSGLDVESVHQALWEQLAAKGLTNTKMSSVKGGALKPEVQKNFDSMAQHSFQGDVTTQQGSQSVVGTAVTLLNSGKNTQLSTKPGFFVFLLILGADEASLKSSLPDVNTMIAGMLGASASS